jgi:hypothetical protein
MLASPIVIAARGTGVEVVEEVIGSISAEVSDLEESGATALVTPLLNSGE